MEKEKNNHVWGFDIGKGSLGEAVRIGGDFKHIASVLLDPEFGEIKTAALVRRQMRTRKAHKAREKWLEECLEGTGVEILKRREVGIVDGQWQLISKGDERLEREFPPSGEDVCYNSIALRCKLLLGEKLEGWQVFKALNSAIQKRGYDENIPWGEAEEKSSKKDDDDYAQKLSQYEKEKSELFESFADGEKYDFPCFFKAYKMGLWSPENPTRVEVRIDCRAQKAKSYVIARKYVEREFECLVEAAAKFFPKLKGRAKFILYGVSETPYASYYGNMRKKFGLKRGAESDWTALGQKVPRFDNRIIDKCRFIPRMNVCKIRPLNEARNEKDLLYYEVTLALKLLNLRFFRNSNIEQLTFEEFKKAFEIAAGAKYKMTKTAMKKFLKSISATALGDDYAEIEPPKESGRASFSRPAMEILKELIFSGMPPREFYGRKISEISNTDKNKGVVSSDLDFIKLMGDCPWGGIFIPDVQTYQFANAAFPDPDAQINKLIGSQNNPIVRHRLTFFFERIKFLESKYGVPDKVVLEFVRDDFMGEKEKKEMRIAMKKRAEEKMRIAKDLDEHGFKGGNLLLKMELYRKQNGICLYTGDALPLSELATLEIEHIVPRSRGGPDAQYNYVITREKTNKLKGDKTPYEWLSSDAKEWASYTDRVNACAKALGKKRCRLLLEKDAEELVEKYTALAETAHIAKLAQKIVCMHFGFQFGGLSGTKRVFTVPGALTSRIRKFYGLDRILHNSAAESENLSFEEFLKFSEDLEKKNRKNKKHHALDAMCLCFAPTGVDSRRAKLGEILPEKLRSEKAAREFFKSYLDKIMPVDVAPKKPRLEDGIYSKRIIGGKACMVKRNNLVDLAYKSGLKPVFDIPTLIKLVDKKEKGIINPQIRKMIGEFAATNPDESAWRKWCEEVRLPSKSGLGARIMRVLVYYGEADEYKDLSKDGCGAYRKGDGHKGQVIWESVDGKYYVEPVYVHASKAGVMAALNANPKKKRICGMFNSHCTVDVGDVYNDKGDFILPAGRYMVNTILTTGRCVLTNADGEKRNPININYLMRAGMRRVELSEL